MGAEEIGPFLARVEASPHPLQFLISLGYGFWASALDTLHPFGYNRRMAQQTSFGERVAFFRRSRGWSQEELARRAKLSRTYLARVETDVQEPRLSTLRQLAAALGVTITALVEETK
jgi:DNA-binding XRE family transcriptional regulator